MKKLEQLLFLNNILLKEMPEYKIQAKKFTKTEEEQHTLLRSLMNLRPPMPISKDFLNIQDEFLKNYVNEKGIISLNALTPINNQIYLWQGDITKLKVDSIVNACNTNLLGCFIPCHKCIDNAIHSISGLKLREDCYNIIQKQGYNEPTGIAKITNAYNLPCDYVIHTVGPIINSSLTKNDCDLLASCYKECLTLAINKNLKSIAFCCISTGEYCFPNDKACEIAISTVKQILNETKSEIKVVFNVFKELDFKLYKKLL